MPKFKVREKFSNGSAQNAYLSATDEATALGICNAIYGGNHQAFEESSGINTEEASLTPVSFKRVNTVLKNDATNDTTFFKFIVKDSVSDLDVIAALKGKTINDVLVDKVTVLSINLTTV